MYGYAAIAGLGIGGTWSIAILYIGFIVEERDMGKCLSERDDIDLDLN
jgi:hypothetical protein